MQSNDIVILGQNDAFDDDDGVIYIPLDCIIDTRLGTLGKINPSLATQALLNGYHERITDEFPGISREEFKAAYAKRDIDTLKMSVVSNVSFLIRRIIKDSLALAVQQKKITRLSIELNVWPYKFEPGPMVDMLISCVRAHAYDNAVVRVVSIPPEKLTPGLIHSNYNMVLMYDWLEWFELHKKFFEKKGLPGLAFIVPQLHIDKPPTREEMEDMRREAGITDVFTATETQFAPIFKLKFMPASLFSMIDEINASNAAQKAARVALTPEDLEGVIKEKTPQAVVEHVPVVAPIISLDDDDFELA